MNTYTYIDTRWREDHYRVSAVIPERRTSPPAHTDRSQIVRGRGVVRVYNIIIRMYITYLPAGGAGRSRGLRDLRRRRLRT